MDGNNELLQSNDARKWAEAFAKSFPQVMPSEGRNTYADDSVVGLMEGWFANAMFAQEQVDEKAAADLLRQSSDEIEPPTDGKYVVFKRHDWDDMKARMATPGGNLILPHPLRVLMDKAVTDGSVIRRQDMFSPPALDAYANSIMVAVTAMMVDPGGYNTALVERLTKVADYFHRQAIAAWETERKLPD